MNDLIKKTLNRIQQEHITPEPRWLFLVRKFSSWLGVVALLIVGAIAVSAAYALLSQLDWDLYHAIHQNMFFYGASMLPYPWLVILGVFLAVAIWGVRKTENGYRFGWSKIIGLVLGGLLLLGLFFSFFGFGNRANSIMSGRIPYFMQYTMTKEIQWMQPEEGLLAGTILTMEKNQFALADLNGKKWVIDFDGQTLIRPAVDFSVGQMVKLVGNRKDGQNFQATEIRPWIGRGKMMNANQGHSMMMKNLNN
ncbi:MAG: hypothetical protein WC823_05850 [Parcubacteria group bacterium]|jgi:hypothetical protein